MIIIASIGVTTAAENDIRKIILAGADVLRHNFSYYSIDKNFDYIDKVQKIVDDLNAHTKHLIDFPLNKVRLGDFNSKIFAVREGEEFIFQSASYSPDCNDFIPVQIPKLGDKLFVDQTITLGDGEIAIQVAQILDSQSIRAKILNNGIIRYMKSFNIRHYQPPTAQILKQYDEIFEKSSLFLPDFYAWSYINHEVNEQIKQLPGCTHRHTQAKTIIKIEDQTGVDDIESICQDRFYDLILIDRGEMGVNMPYEKIGLYQKEIIKVAKKQNKPIIISTQILDSAINNYIPSRADIQNLTELALENVDGIMFCQETVVGSRPAYPIHVSKKIVSAVENQRHQKIELP